MSRLEELASRKPPLSQDELDREALVTSVEGWADRILLVIHNQNFKNIAFPVLRF